MGERLQWKKVLSIWIGMYPVNVATSWVITMLPWWGGVSLPARSAIVVTVVAPIMCLVMMPAVTRLLAPWLRRTPEQGRIERELCARLDALAAPPCDAEEVRASRSRAERHRPPRSSRSDTPRSVRSDAGLRYAEEDRGGAASLHASVGRSRWSDSTRWSSEPGYPG
ncbi:hypothetical protein ACWGOE_13655 [Leucobacter chromiiresistens]